LVIYTTDNTNTDKRMAIRRYTESVNTRFEVGIVKLLDEALTHQYCVDNDFNRSDLIRHLVRIGLKNFETNQPSQENFNDRQ
jgi:hypothetical protein